MIRKERAYIPGIDVVKFLAIISVILLHTIPRNILYKIYAPFHIWQAIPLFMVLAGITSTLSIERRGGFNKSYFTKSLVKYLKRLVLPFSLVWVIEILAISIFSKMKPFEYFYTYITGGIGPGSYFTPIFIQHIIIFPFIYYLIMKLKKMKVNKYFQILFFLGVSLLADFLCLFFGVPDWLYRLLYVRYMFAVILGIFIFKFNFSRTISSLAIIGSFIYIYAISYFKYTPIFHHNSWGSQHAPSYFYTGLMIIFIFKLPDIYKTTMEKFNLPEVSLKPLLTVGKASYHIYLTQMVYFAFLHSRITNSISILTNSAIIKGFLYLVSSLSISISLGVTFYLLHIGLLEWQTAINKNEV